MLNSGMITNEGIEMANGTFGVEKGKEVILNIHEIEWDPKWNARTRDEVTSENPDGEGATFEQIVKSIETDGQDTAVIVRPNSKDRKKPFFLVAGFTRLSAMLKIAEKKGDKNPTIKAIVRDLTELDARRLNLRENTARADLKPADLVYGITDLLRLFKSNNVKVTSQLIADELAMSQAHANNLMTIAEQVPEPILKDWRDSSLQASIEDMKKVAAAPLADKKSVYEEITRKKAESGEDPSRGKGAWIKTAKKNAEAVGYMLGKLVFHGDITIKDEDSFFYENISLLVKLPQGKNKNGTAKCTDKQKASVAKVCADSYVKSYNAGDENEEEEEEKPKGKRGKSQASAEN